MKVTFVKDQPNMASTLGISEERGEEIQRRAAKFGSETTKRLAKSEEALIPADLIGEYIEAIDPQTPEELVLTGFLMPSVLNMIKAIHNGGPAAGIALLAKQMASL